jgi:flagellar protein FlaJ
MLAVKLSRSDKRIVNISSIAICVAILVNTVFVWPGLNRHPEFETFFVIALIIALFPPAAADLLDRRWRSVVNAKLPDLVKNISDAQKTGMSFPKAIEHSARVDYGPLTKELRKTVALLSWGWTYEEALQDLARRIDTPLAHRLVALLIEVGRAGGRLHEVLDAIYTHFREAQEIERDRKRQLVPYVMTIYAAFGVFLFLVYILFSTLFFQAKQLAAAGTFFLSGLNTDLYYIWFFHLAVVEAVISGFVAGKMGEGALSAGLKHALILLLISILAFAFVIRPP